MPPDPQPNPGSGNSPPGLPPTPSSNSSGNPSSENEEVDVTDDIEKLISYVTKKKEDDPHDSVLSRISSRLQDIAEKLGGNNPSSPNTPTVPETPTVSVPGIEEWKYYRIRGGRIIKRKVETPKP